VKKTSKPCEELPWAYFSHQTGESQSKGKHRAPEQGVPASYPAQLMPGLFKDCHSILRRCERRRGLSHEYVSVV
jgi:hypothetical protein